MVCGSRTTLALLGAAVAILVTSGAGIAIPDPDGSLPTKPDFSQVSGQYPTCDITTKSVSVLEKCRSDLEDFRNYVLEPFNTRTLKRYAANLRKASADLENSRAKGKISAARYRSLHQEIADELGNTTSDDGDYLNSYREYVNKYQEDVQRVLHRQNICTHVLGCGG